MKKLIYLNLFIDNEWDEEKILDSVFIIQIPSSRKILNSYFALGVFLADNDDVVMVEDKIDDGFLKYLSLFFSLPKFILSNEINKQDVERLRGLFAGVSKKEEELIYSNDLSGANGGASLYKKLNSKFFLYEISLEKRIFFPVTEKIELAKILDEHKKGDEYFLKFPFGSGGRGVFYIDDSRLDMIKVFSERLGGGGPFYLLKQKSIDVRSFLYTVSDNSIAGFLPVTFEIFFDKNNNSYRHKRYEGDDSLMRDAAKYIAKKLELESYHGPFGFDGMIDTKGELYPAIDLNVRYDKSRVILEAVKKFGIEDFYYESIRRRFHRDSFLSFEKFWKEMKDRLGLDEKGFSAEGMFFIPFLFSNFFSAIKSKQMMEVTFFVGNIKKDQDRVSIDKWLEKIDKSLGVFL